MPLLHRDVGEQFLGRSLAGGKTNDVPFVIDGDKVDLRVLAIPGLTSRM